MHAQTLQGVDPEIEEAGGGAHGFLSSESASVEIGGHHKSTASSYLVCGIAMMYFTLDNLH